MEATVLDLRKKMKDVLNAIDRNERVILTHRGRPKAWIIPVAEKKHHAVKIEDLPAFGMWADREEMKSPSEFVEELRQGRFG